MRIVLIDADIIVYTVCFTLARRLKEGKKVDINTAHSVTDTLVKEVLRKSKATHYLGFLTESKSNFRLKVAVTLPYKGGRKTNKDKPIFYKEVRQYLRIHWQCQLMRGVEADDALTIASEAFKNNKGITTIIATKDKDLWQYPGEHYNMNTKKLMNITQEEAHRNLWGQVITGDMSTDNICGLSHAGKGYSSSFDDPKVRMLGEHTYGPKTASVLLEGVPQKEYSRVVLEEYLWAYGSIGAEESWEDLGLLRFYETFDLVYMLREAPKGLQIHFNPVKVKQADLEFDDDFDGFRPALEF